eukprot:10041907-Alexandrium_andersonii.AAC.1
MGKPWQPKAPRHLFARSVGQRRKTRGLADASPSLYWVSRLPKAKLRAPSESKLKVSVGEPATCTTSPKQLQKHRTQ